MDAGWLDIQNRLFSIGSFTASLLNDVGHGNTLVEQPQLKWKERCTVFEKLELSGQAPWNREEEMYVYIYIYSTDTRTSKPISGKLNA